MDEFRETNDPHNTFYQIMKTITHFLYFLGLLVCILIVKSLVLYPNIFLDICTGQGYLCCSMKVSQWSCDWQRFVYYVWRSLAHIIPWRSHSLYFPSIRSYKAPLSRKDCGYSVCETSLQVFERSV